MAERLEFRCAVESRSREEPLVGTAPRVKRWLLIEQPGPWGDEALVESQLDRIVARSLRAASRRLGVRVVLIRRPGWQRAETQRAFLVHSGHHDAWVEQLDLADPGELLRLDLRATASPEPPGVGDPGPAAVHLVCTHGRHDPCWADRGRPVVRALTDAGTPEVWEASHVGGDRFAANVVCLPTGIYFGRVEADEAERVLRDLGDGLIDLDRYRGRSCFAPLAQAAEIFARREIGERRFTALDIVRSRQMDDGAEVELRHTDGRRVVVHVSRERGEREHLTCSSNGTARPWRYRLVSLTVA